ncbi:MAG: hypothetical protein IPL79_19940 [Myxococcales bacterium]|nr:hypothetical protein [Myxococcales bacterium]
MTAPAELRRAVTLARGLGILRAVIWRPEDEGVFLRLPEEPAGCLRSVEEVPALLAAAIARTPPTGSESPRNRDYLLDTMEDLAALVPWWEVKP